MNSQLTYNDKRCKCDDDDEDDIYSPSVRNDVTVKDYLFASKTNDNDTIDDDTITLFDTNN